MKIKTNQISPEIIKQQIEEYRSQIQIVERQANMQIASLQGAIQALELLLKPEESNINEDKSDQEA